MSQVAGIAAISIVLTAALHSAAGSWPAEYSGCTATWSTVETRSIRLPANTVAIGVSAAAKRDDLFFALTLTTAGDTVPPPEMVVMGRFKDQVAPLPMRIAGFPRLISAGGAVAAFWGDIPDSSSVRTPFLMPYTQVWHSLVPSDGRWKPSRLLEDDDRIWWRPAESSHAVAPTGDIHFVITNAALNPSSFYHVIIPSTGEPRVRRFNMRITSAYSSIALAGDTILIAHAGIQDDFRPLGGFGVYVYRSTDYGRTWEPPYELPNMADLAATTITLARTPDGQYHAMAGVAPQGSVWTESFLYLVSTDGGINWSDQATLSVPTGAQDPHLIAGPCGGLHFAFRDSDSRGTRIMYTTFTGDAWQPVVFMDARALSFTMFSDSSSGHFVHVSDPVHGVVDVTWKTLMR